MLSTDPDISDPGEQAGFLAEQTSWWRGTWDITLEATDSVPLAHQLFLLWMAFILNRRASSTAATGAIAGGAAAAAGSS